MYEQFYPKDRIFWKVGVIMFLTIHWFVIVVVLLLLSFRVVLV